MTVVHWDTPATVDRRVRRPLRAGGRSRPRRQGRQGCRRSRGPYSWWRTTSRAQSQTRPAPAPVRWRAKRLPRPS